MDFLYGAVRRRRWVTCRSGANGIERSRHSRVWLHRPKLMTSANDELDGARRVGMDAILIHRPGEGPLWPELDDWGGLRVTSIPEVLELTRT